MGSKGTAAQQQQGTSTYTPNQATYGAGTQALSMAQGAASQPFNLPTAPVAGFSPQQQQAFQQYGDLQNIYQPYYNQAQRYFNQSAAPVSGSDVSQYMNPYAGYVMGNLQEQQGQQMNQLTGSATQTAGGVGADRIGVAQGELARQQGLATGQTLSGIYGSALSAAQQQKQMEQSAGYGLGNLGGANLNSALSATGALYGSGSYQQQQNQAQMNAQYQNQLQQQAYPFQTAQYLANITGGLSGALGGTTNTSQYGQSTPAQPSIWSQILGGAGIGTALLGQSGAFGPTGTVTGSSPSYGGGNMFSGDGYGGNSNNPLPGLSPGDYGPGFASGGGVSDVTGDPSWMTSDPGVGSGKITAAPLNIPKITPMNMSGGNSSGASSTTSDLGNIAKIATMFMADGGSVDNPFPTFDEKGRMLGNMTSQQGVVPTSNALHEDTDSTVPPNAKFISGNTNPYADVSEKAAAIANQNRGEMSNQKFTLPYDVDHQKDESREWSRSPWMALLAGSAATMAGTSPYAGVNIGQGVQAGVKQLGEQRKESREEESINQRAKQLSLEAQKHLDQYTRMTPKEAADIEQKQNTLEQAGWQKGSENILNGDVTWFNPRSGESGILKADGTWTPKGASAPPAPAAGTQPPVAPPPAGVQPPAPPPGAPLPQAGTPLGAQPPAPPPQAPPPQAAAPPIAPPPPMGVKDLASNLEPGSPGIGFMGKGSPLGTAATKDAQVEIARQSKAAAALPALRQDIEGMKLAYATLTKDTDKDGFLSRVALQPGATFGERLEYAKKANALKAAAGEPPPFDPEKVAAAENINKVQNRMGLTFSSQISPREAFAGQKIGIESSPGLTNTPRGFQRLISGFEAAAQNAQDEQAFFQNYLKKNGTSLGWRQDFEAKNPPERYVVRSLIGTLPPETQQHLAEDVEALRKDPSEKNKKLFNQHYMDTANYFLHGKT